MTESLNAARPDRRDVAAGALLGTFVGDALGMPFEGMAADQIPVTAEMEEARLGRGTYTDDTEMTIALAESLVERGAVAEDDLAARFLKHNSMRGYGRGTLEVFSLWRRGVPVEEAAGRIFAGKGSLGNGAAMRIAPIGVLFARDGERLVDQARRSARVTHAHPLGIDAAVVQAAAVAAAARGAQPLACAAAVARSAELRAKLEQVSALLRSRPDPSLVAAQLGNSSAAHESVSTAIFAACAHEDFEDAVRFAIRCGGDTDTIGAMTGAIVGAREGASSIPDRWREALEDGPRGRRYVLDLAARLASAAL